MRTICCLLSFLTMLLVSCDEDNMDSKAGSGQPGDVVLFSSYEGIWYVDGRACGSSVMMVHDGSFNFVSLPSEAILRHLLRDRTVDDADDTGYIVPYAEAGYSSQAFYYSVEAVRWDIAATVGGRRMVVGVMFEPYNSLGYGSVATFSKLSGVYKIVMKVSGCELSEPAPCGPVSSPEGTTISFVTTRKL